MTPDQQIAVIRAKADGLFVEQKKCASNVARWEPMPQTSAFNFEQFDYRIKPQILEAWATVFKDGTVHFKLERNQIDPTFNPFVARPCVHLIEFTPARLHADEAFELVKKVFHLYSGSNLPHGIRFREDAAEILNKMSS